MDYKSFDWLLRYSNFGKSFLYNRKGRSFLLLLSQKFIHSLKTELLV